MLLCIETNKQTKKQTHHNSCMIFPENRKTLLPQSFLHPGQKKQMSTLILLRTNLRGYSPEQESNQYCPSSKTKAKPTHSPPQSTPETKGSACQQVCTSLSQENTWGFGDKGKSPGGKATSKSLEQSHANQRAQNWKGGERNERPSSESRINVYSFINRYAYCCPEGTYHHRGTRGQEDSEDAEGGRRYCREAALSSLSKLMEIRGGSPWLEKSRCCFNPKQGKHHPSLWKDCRSSNLHVPGNSMWKERRELGSLYQGQTVPNAHQLLGWDDRICGKV